MKIFKTDSPVRFIQPPIEGVIIGGRLSESGDAVDYRVAFPLPDGSWSVRDFPSEQLEALLETDAERVLTKHADFLAVRQSESDIDEAAARLHRSDPERKDALTTEQLTAEAAVVAKERLDAAAEVDAEVKS